MNLSKLLEIVEDLPGEPSMLQPMGLQTVAHDLAT